MIDRIRPLKERNHSSTNSLSMAEIMDLAVSALGLVDRFYVLIDALNETSYQHQIVPVLSSFCRACPNVRVLVTCTSNPQVSGPEISIQKLSSQAIDHDIQVYVRHRLATEPNFLNLSEKIKERIRERMALGADGT